MSRLLTDSMVTLALLREFRTVLLHLRTLLQLGVAMDLLDFTMTQNKNSKCLQINQFKAMLSLV